VFVPPNLYDVTARRSVRKHGIQGISVGLLFVLLITAVGSSVGIGVVPSWFQWLLILLVLACRRVESVIADSFLFLGVLVVSLAEAHSPTR